MEEKQVWPPLPTSDLTHDDGALLGDAGPAGSADEGEHALHAVQLLPQKDVHGGEAGVAVVVT